MAIASTGTTLENPYCYFQVSQLNKKQSDLTHRKFIAATAATTLLFLGGYPGKVVAQEKTLYSQSGQSVENNVNNDSVERPGQGAITTQSIPPDDCIGVVYGINPPPQLGSLSGNVFATENEVSDNIVGAMITISNEYKEYIGISDSNGTFSIPDILVGEYNVKVEKVGFEEYMLEETWICTNKNTELPGIELVKSFPWELFYPAFIKKK
jgi:hypothetical protein